MDNRVLIHHGIKGMRWGIRRFQNKNGSLTLAGKKRYGDNDSSGRIPSDDHIQAKALKKKRVYEMSNKELEALTRRMQLEKQYKDLNRQSMSRGQKMIVDVLNEVGKETLKSVTKDFVTKKTPNIIEAIAKSGLKAQV